MTARALSEVEVRLRSMTTGGEGSALRANERCDAIKKMV